MARARALIPRLRDPDNFRHFAEIGRAAARGVVGGGYIYRKLSDAWPAVKRQEQQQHLRPGSRKRVRGPLPLSLRSMPRNSRSGRSYRTSGRRRRPGKRSNRKKKRTPFSTIGFKLLDQQRYHLSTDADLERGGFSLAFKANFIYPFLKSATASWHCPTGYNAAAVDRDGFFFGRIKFNLGAFTTASGIQKHFNKAKINWVKMEFKFPDQEAATSNNDYPLTMGVNYSDMTRYSCQAQSEYGGSLQWPDSTPSFGRQTITDQLERPGWKWTAIKRVNKKVIKFVPRIYDIDEGNTVAALTNDVTKLVKNKYIPLDAVGIKTAFVGPSLAFYGKKTPVTPETNSFTVDNTFSANNFLQYSTVVVTASISFKDRTATADD